MSCYPLCVRSNVYSVRRCENIVSMVHHVCRREEALPATSKSRNFVIMGFTNTGETLYTHMLVQCAVYHRDQFLTYV